MNFSAEYQLTFEEYSEAMTHIARSLREQKPASAGRKRGTISWVVYAVLAILLLVLLYQGHHPKPSAKLSPPSRSVGDWMLLLLPWVLIFGFLFYAFRSLRGRSRRRWDKNPFLHRVQRITITNDSFTRADMTSENRFSWAHYTRFLETPNLFLLFTSKFAAELVPKRIFANSDDVDQFRSLLERSISAPVAAFPVIPVSTADVEGGKNDLH